MVHASQCTTVVYRNAIPIRTTVVYDPAMSRTDAQMKIRLPDDLREAIEAAATAAGRTLNAEVVQRLSATFTVDGDVSALARRVEELQAQRDDAYRAVRALQGTQSALAKLTLASVELAGTSKAPGARATLDAARAVAAAMVDQEATVDTDAHPSPAPAGKPRAASRAKK